ncbi:MAG TPA: hypothetical protein VMG30_19190 [Acidobacteriota bacterium]|nr:hypothetical protein [Acidobacteriota bacterium]
MKKLLHLAFVWLTLTMPSARSQIPSPARSGIEPQIQLGFNLLYSLKFSEARKQFDSWQQTHPDDPMGYLGTAASYLFEELQDKQVLTSKFFLDNKRLLGGIEGEPDNARKRDFLTANQKGKELALKQLDADPRNAAALFALATANGMQGNFAAILEKNQTEGISLIRKAEHYARQTIALQPDNVDAWFSVGATNYIIGCMPAYRRFLLWFGGIQGDKRLGMEQLRITADRGRYFKPFAEIFLAMAAMREKQDDLARSLLRDLAQQFPENPLYNEELARLDGAHEGPQNGGR